MKSYHRFFSAVISCLISVSLYAIDWLPIDPADLAATESANFPDTEAEILYYYEEYDDRAINSGCTIDHYIRIKIYKERVIEELSKVDILSPEYTPARKIMARIIKPDGRIIEVDKKTFHPRDIVNYKGIKIKNISFTFPKLEVGDIIEYKWVNYSSRHYTFVKLYPTREWPARKVHFRISPYARHGYLVNAHYFKCEKKQFTPEKNYFSSLILENMPAFKTEPYMPPKDNVCPWIMFYMTPDLSDEKDDYWAWNGKFMAGKIEDYTRKPSKRIREAAKEIIGDATHPEEKARLINDYCRTRILNTARYVPTAVKVVKHLDIPDPDYVLKHKQGDSYDIVVFYLALARAAGLEARLALCPDFTDGVFRKGINVFSYINYSIVAVKNGEQWLFFDPASRNIPTGSLFWYNEGMPVLITDKNNCTWGNTPITPAKESYVKRNATLELSEDGTLHGKVRIEYGGHYASSARGDFMFESPEKCEELTRKWVQEFLPTAEVTEVEFPNIEELLENPYITLNIRVPDYAELLGKRLFIQPNIFSKGAKPKFTAETREHDIFFQYPVMEDDEISIKLPDGVSLEAAHAPESVEKANWGNYKINITVNRRTNTLTYKRNYAFALTEISKAAYPQIRSLFNAILLRDQHTLTLKINEESETQ